MVSAFARSFEEDDVTVSVSRDAVSRVCPTPNTGVVAVLSVPQAMLDASWGLVYLSYVFGQAGAVVDHPGLLDHMVRVLKRILESKSQEGGMYDPGSMVRTSSVPSARLGHQHVCSCVHHGMPLLAVARACAGECPDAHHRKSGDGP